MSKGKKNDFERHEGGQILRARSTNQDKKVKNKI